MPKHKGSDYGPSSFGVTDREIPDSGRKIYEPAYTIPETAKKRLLEGDLLGFFKKRPGDTFFAAPLAQLTGIGLQKINSDLRALCVLGELKKEKQKNKPWYYWYEPTKSPHEQEPGSSQPGEEIK